MCFKSNFTTPAVVVVGFCLIGGTSPAPAYADIGDQLFKLLANDGAAADHFGLSVAISGATAIVGAQGNDDNGDNSGSAYLFDATTGQQIAKLLPNDGTAGDGFGLSVAISGTTAIVGARFDDYNGTSSGSAYLFDISDPASPTQVAKLLPNDGAASDQFGNSVAMSGTTAIVGAFHDDDNGADSGSAYVFGCAVVVEDWDQDDPPWGTNWYASSADSDFAEFDPVSDFVVALHTLADLYPGQEIPLQQLKVYLSTSFINNATFFPDRNMNGHDDVDLHLLADTVWERRPNYSMASVGCAITSLALAANALNGSTKTPGELYAQIRTVVDGRFRGLQSITKQLTRFASSSVGLVPRFVKLNVLWGPVHKILNTWDDGYVPVDADVLRNALDDCKVAIMRAHGHYSVIDRYRDNAGIIEFWEQDPSATHDWIAANSTEFGRFSTMKIVRAREGPGGALNGPSSLEELRIHVTGAREILVTDPNGDSLGVDPETGQPADSLPGAFGPDVAPSTPDDMPSDEEMMEIEGLSPREFVIYVPAEGTYQINVGDLVDEIDAEVTLTAAWTTPEGQTVEETLVDNFPSGLGQFTIDVFVPLACPADLDANGSVGVKDLLILLGTWGPCPPKGDCPADLDNSGDVGVKDLLVLLGNWGPCP